MIGEELAKIKGRDKISVERSATAFPAPHPIRWSGNGSSTPGKVYMLTKTLKKLGLPILALAGMLMFVGAPKADAAVHFGVGIGVPYGYGYPYPYAYGYGYPYYGGFYGGWGGGWGRGYGGRGYYGGGRGYAGRGYGGGGFRGAARGGGGFHGGGGHGGGHR